MTLNELDKYFRSFLKIEDFAADPSMNGIQIQNANPAEKEIKKVAEFWKKGIDILMELW